MTVSTVRGRQLAATLAPPKGPTCFKAHGPTGHDQGQATAPASSYVALCSPAVSPLAPHWRKHSRTQVGYVLVVVTHSLGHLHARVKTDRRFNGLVAKQAAHDLVATRVVS